MTYTNYVAVLLLSSAAYGAEAMRNARVGVVVVGATPAGVAAAIGAARFGIAVTVVEESNHIGGIISAGMTQADIGNSRALGGLWNEYQDRLRAFYADAYGINSPQYRACRNGTRCEPHVAEAIFRAMLRDWPRIALLVGHRLTSVRVSAQRLRAIEIERYEGGGRQVVEADTFIDATYEGDLAAAAGASYRVGRESRATYGESLAGRIYTKFGSRERLPGSTGEPDAGVQAYCFRIPVTADPKKRIGFEKPGDYRRDEYAMLLADIKAGRVRRMADAMQMIELPNGKVQLSSADVHPEFERPSQSFDLAEENWGWPEADQEWRQRFFRRCWTYHEGLLWFLQTDSEVPDTLRREVARFGFCRDEFVDNNHRPYLLYVRQGRRIDGEYVFTQREEELDPATGLPRVHAQSIAVAAFAWDSHGVRKFDSKFPGTREGQFFVTHPPLQVPYGVLVPIRIDGLLVPVACSASHVGYQALRLEPDLMSLGQVAGIASAIAIHEQLPVRAVGGWKVQREFVRQNGVIAYFSDLSPDHPSFGPLQRLAPYGFAKSWAAMPDTFLSEADAAERLTRVLRSLGQPWTLSEVSTNALRRATADRWLASCGLKLPTTEEDSEFLTVGDFARRVVESFDVSSWTPRQSDPLQPRRG